MISLTYIIWVCILALTTDLNYKEALVVVAGLVVAVAILWKNRKELN